MIYPGYPTGSRQGSSPASKPDRLVVGILAGAALVLLAGKLLGLGGSGKPAKDERA